MGWTVEGSNPGRARFSAVQTGPGAHPASCTMGTGSFPRVKRGRGVLLTTHPLLVPRSGSVELYLYPPSGSHQGLLRGYFILYLYIYVHLLVLLPYLRFRLLYSYKNLQFPLLMVYKQLAFDLNFEIVGVVDAKQRTT